MYIVKGHKSSLKWRVPSLSQARETYLASFELPVQVATEAGCYNDSRI